MKRIVNGKTYDTEASTSAARYEYEDDNGNYREATIYRNRCGVLFIVHDWVQRDSDGENRRKHLVEPIDQEKFYSLSENYQLEILDEDALPLPPEAGCATALMR